MQSMIDRLPLPRLFFHVVYRFTWVLSMKNLFTDHRVWYWSDWTLLISGRANAAVITHFPRVANISISCSECSDSNKRMHVQYMLQLDLEVNSKQIGDASLSRSLSPSPPLSYLLRFFFRNKQTRSNHPVNLSEFIWPVNEINNARHYCI